MVPSIVSVKYEVTGWWRRVQGRNLRRESMQVRSGKGDLLRSESELSEVCVPEICEYNERTAGTVAFFSRSSQLL